MKTFKHPKLWRIATQDKYGKSYKMNDSYYYEEELLALWFEEVKNSHFWNWMMDCKLFKAKWRLIETQNKITSEERLDNCSIEETDWAFFQTEEQAKQFDKMMMTVWKIWKWKKENDDTEWWEYSLYYNRQKKKFGWADYTTEYEYGFFLPRFSSSNDVHRLISDLWEELNNLLCWIK